MDLYDLGVDMMQDTVVQCDNCKGGFKIDLKMRRLKDAIEETYFTCPYCQYHYTSFFTDISVREKQRSIRQLWDKLHNTKDQNKIIHIQERIENEKAEIKVMMDDLKVKYHDV